MSKTPVNPTGRVPPSRLYMALLSKTFAHFTGTDPVVLAIDADEPPGSQSDFEPWAMEHVLTAAELPSRAGLLLQTGPVLLLPPWRRRQERWREWQDEYQAVLTECVPPQPDAFLAAVIPAAGLISVASAKFRRTLAQYWHPSLVLHCRAIFSSVHSQMEIATIFLTPKDANLQHLLRMFEYSPSDDESVVLNDFDRLLKREGGRGKLGYVLRDIPTPEAGLSFGRHDPLMKARQDSIADLGGAVKGNDVFERVFYAFHVPADAHLFCNPDHPDAVRVISGRDLQREGTIGPPDEEAKWALVPADRQLQADDVLLQALAAPSDRRGLRAIRVMNEDLPLVANQSVIVLRFKSSVSESQRHLIVQYLRSPLAREVLAYLSPGVHVSATSLRELPIPQPDEALSVALDDLARAARKFEEWRTEAEDVLQSAFPRDEDFKAARLRLVRRGRTSRLRVDAAANLDDYSYIVRTRFPYPVAYRWRLVEAEKSAKASRNTYDAILQTAEVLLSYVAHLALVLVRSLNVELGYSSTIRTTFQRGRGLGFGDWTSIVEEVQTSKALRSVPDAHPLRNLQKLLASPDARDALRRLYDRRNDESHLRNVDAADLPVAIEAALQDLLVLLKAADFLSDLPLIYVTDVRWDSIRRRSQVTYRELMGDHPVAPTRVLAYDDPGIEVYSLYLVDGRHRLHLLRPFLIGQPCPKCRNWSTFHVDRVDQEKVVLKGLEHGHTTNDHTLVEALRLVGFV